MTDIHACWSGSQCSWMLLPVWFRSCRGCLPLGQLGWVDAWTEQNRNRGPRTLTARSPSVQIASGSHNLLSVSNISCIICKQSLRSLGTSLFLSLSISITSSEAISLSLFFPGRGHALFLSPSISGFLLSLFFGAVVSNLSLLFHWDADIVVQGIKSRNSQRKGRFSFTLWLDGGFHQWENQ